MTTKQLTKFDKSTTNHLKIINEQTLLKKSDATIKRI